MMPPPGSPSRPAAERIAEVVADIRAGKARHPAATDPPGRKVSAVAAARARLDQPVVDCTAIFDQQRALREIDLYGAHQTITPPWENALLCYVNTFGNVICMQVHLVERGADASAGWDTHNDVDWEQVRWTAETMIWVGGTSGDGQHLPPSGPCHMFRHAISNTGAPLDLNWIALLARHDNDPNLPMWEPALVTLNASLGFLNCSNVGVAEPSRPRPTRRRIARTGVPVQTIVVRPPGRRRASSTTVRPLDPSEAVLSSVRGHFAYYGPEHGRGLLFGKYPGKFWIAGHVRGVTGEANNRTYTLKPEIDNA